MDYEQLTNCATSKSLVYVWITISCILIGIACFLAIRLWQTQKELRKAGRIIDMLRKRDLSYSDEIAKQKLAFATLDADVVFVKDQFRELDKNHDALKAGYKELHDRALKYKAEREKSDKKLVERNTEYEQLLQKVDIVLAHTDLDI